VEPSLAINWIDLPAGSFGSRLAAARFSFAPSPRSVLGALVQYNSSQDSFSSNIRLRWEHAPGSEVFLVYSDGRVTLGSGFTDLKNRTLAVKVIHVARF